MTYFMSRANWDRCVEGMTPEQRYEFSRDFVPYPDRTSPDGEIDLERVGQAWDALHAATQPAPPPWWFAEPSQPTWPRTWGRGWPKDAAAAQADLFVSRPKGNGKTWPTLHNAPASMTFIWPEQPPPDIYESAASDDWINVGDLVGDWVSDTEANYLRRYFINDWKPAEPANPIDDMMAWWERYRDQLPRAQRINAGDVAIGAFRLAGRPALVHVHTDLAPMLTGTPIVPDPDLPEDVYQLVDAETGDVLFEGVISETLANLVRTMRGLVDDMAEKTGVPRDLLSDF